MSDALRTIAVVIGAVDPETRDEAMRAALGLTLRNARVHVVVAPLGVQLSGEAQRACSLLTMMGHPVDNPGVVRAALETADAIAVWGGVHPERPGAPATGSRRITHLVRPGHRPACPAPGEPVLELPALPPRDGSAGPNETRGILDRDVADRLLDQLLTGGPVAIW